MDKQSNTPLAFGDQHDANFEDQLKQRYGQCIVDGEIDPEEQTFAQYLHCMQEEALMDDDSQDLATYKFMVRETLTETVEVEAASFEDARKEVERQYDDGEIYLDHDCFACVEFRPLCAECESDFDDATDGLREVNECTPMAMMICDHCVADMEDSGKLTRCECCGNPFTPSRLEINPQNGEQEICPECGEVWCE